MFGRFNGQVACLIQLIASKIVTVLLTEPISEFKSQHLSIVNDILINFCGAGVRYEIGTSIESDRIVWAHGLFACGTWPDVNKFQSRMVDGLNNGEEIVADRGIRHSK